MAGGLDHPDVADAGCAELRGHPFGGAQHVELVSRVGADAGDARELDQLGKDLRLVVRQPGAGRGGSAHAPTASSGSSLFIASVVTRKRTTPLAGETTSCSVLPR